MPNVQPSGPPGARPHQGTGATAAPRTLQVALNGAVTHAAMPRTPEETAEDAAASVAAGANLLHFHAFDDDGTESLAAEHVTRAIRAVRARCPGAPISMTTFAGIEPDPRRRFAAIAGWTELPDLIPANQGEEGIVELSELLARRGVGIEACVLSVADAEAFVRRGSFPRFARVVVEALDDDASQALAEVAEMEAILRRAQVPLEQVQHGFGAGAWPVLLRAAERGHGVRTGLEDTDELPDGRPAAGNLQLVEAAAEIVRRAPRQAGDRAGTPGRS